ncbi:SDR family oxidoreductase [Tepidibacillus marianensis]|uniref:SDR family oxidoreductase n=1 Tax=Tepidibacillus marianensis TaxID=3131995 RepID=UPI0030D06596
MIRKKVALVTGGSKGLGKNIAQRLAKEGFHVIINYHHDHEAAKQVVQRINEIGQTAIALHGDVTNPSQMRELFQQIEQQYHRLDVIVLSVGPFIRQRKTFYEMEWSETMDMIHGNLTSALLTTSFALPMMRKQGRGRIIYFGFHRANEAPAWPDRSVYAAAKVGLVSFCKTLAVEEAPFGITVNMIAPSDIVGDYKEKQIEQVIGMVDNESLRGRPGTGEDVSRVVSFLCEDQSDFITGNVISVSGGLDIIHPISKQFQKENEE